MLVGKCHCGRVKLSYEGEPKHLTSCNCSICHRIGALWAHGEVEDISVEAEALLEYSWGDKAIAFCSCAHCGCTTHWRGLSEEGTRMAVNARMFERKEIEGFRIRNFDGADTWEFLNYGVRSL